MHEQRNILTMRTLFYSSACLLAHTRAVVYRETYSKSMFEASNSMELLYLILIITTFGSPLTYPHHEESPESNRRCTRRYYPCRR